jgi:hypothetical protein
MVCRQRTATKVYVLPPGIAPLSKDDEEKAVQAIASMIAAWWRDHGRDAHPPAKMT